MVRLYLGGYYIECNDCARVTKGFQTLLLFVGLFMLLFIDALMIVADDLFPKGALVANWKTIIFLGSLYAIYFTIMGLAMYPGIPKSADRIDQAS